jgi:hypothetical protein
MRENLEKVIVRKFIKIKKMVLSEKCPILGVDNVKLLGLSSMKVRQSVAPKMIPLPQYLCKWESYFCA